MNCVWRQIIQIIVEGTDLVSCKACWDARPFIEIGTCCGSSGLNQIWVRQQFRPLCDDSILYSFVRDLRITPPLLVWFGSAPHRTELQGAEGYDSRDSALFREGHRELDLGVVGIRLRRWVVKAERALSVSCTLMINFTCEFKEESKFPSF